MLNLPHSHYNLAHNNDVHIVHFSHCVQIDQEMLAQANSKFIHHTKEAYYYTDRCWGDVSRLQPSHTILLDAKVERSFCSYSQPLCTVKWKHWITWVVRSLVQSAHDVDIFVSRFIKNMYKYLRHTHNIHLCIRLKTVPVKGRWLLCACALGNKLKVLRYFFDHYAIYNQTQTGVQLDC